MNHLYEISADGLGSKDWYIAKSAEDAQRWWEADVGDTLRDGSVLQVPDDMDFMLKGEDGEDDVTKKAVECFCPMLLYKLKKF